MSQKSRASKKHNFDVKSLCRVEEGYNLVVDPLYGGPDLKQRHTEMLVKEDHSWAVSLCSSPSQCDTVVYNMSHHFNLYLPYIFEQYHMRGSSVVAL